MTVQKFRSIDRRTFLRYLLYGGISSSAIGMGVLAWDIEAEVNHLRLERPIRC